MKMIRTGKLQLPIVSGLVAAVPALIMGLLLLRIFVVPFHERYLWILFLAISFLIVMGIAFVINLLVPCAKDRNIAVLMAVPTLAVFYYIFAIRPFFTNISSGNLLEDVGFQLIWALICDPPIGCLLLFGVAFFSRLGVKVNECLSRRGRSM